MAPKADETQLNNLENTLEAAMALNMIYKIIRHFYLLGKKTNSLYTILQIQMVLPMIMKQAEAYAHALRAFAVGQPIGDGAGALVAAKLMQGHKTKEIARDVNENPEILHTAPHNTPVRRLDEVRAARQPDLRWEVSNQRRKD